MIVAAAFLHDIMHPLGVCTGDHKTVSQCRGYNFWSGLGSDLGEVTIVTMMVGFAGAWWHKHNCHVKGCPWLSWHPNPETGHPECRKHHPDPHSYLSGGRSAA